MPSKFYIRSYDRFDEVLIIDPETRDFALSSREDVNRLGIKKGGGAFVKESDHVIGIHASPEGPILFFDKLWILAQQESTSAELEKNDSSGINRFAVIDNGRHIFGISYKDRPGLEINPYDKEPEDVDLFALISSGLKKPQFFLNYKKKYGA